MLKKKIVAKDVASGARKFTTQEIKAVGRGDWLNVEFIDLDGLRAMFGIKRSLAYALLKEGKIRGVSLRRVGRVRGKRLFSVASVRAFVTATGGAR